MNDWFEWNGVRSTEYGVTVAHEPIIPIPAERQSTVKLYGRSGTLTKLEGQNVLDEITISVECNVSNPSRIGEIAQWLLGGGMLMLPKRPGGYWKARVNNQIPLARVIRTRQSCTINFRCQPHFYRANVPSISPAASGTITNPGTAESRPKITLTGTGKVHITIGTQTVNLNIGAASTAVVLDCDLQECYKVVSGAPVSLNSIMTGDFPAIPTGAVALSYGAQTGATGSVTSVVIEPRWRDV